MQEIQADGQRFYTLYQLSGARLFEDEGKDAVVDEELLTKAQTEDPRLVIPIALADANDIRRALAIGEGKLEKLPAAVLGNAEDCVLARALSNGWRASVSTSDTTIAHPHGDISFAQVQLAVETLGRLGFIGVRSNPNYDLAGIEGVGSGECYWIVIPHTWAMAEFITWYDKGAFPELVLDRDEEGREMVERFKSLIERGYTLDEIHEGRYV